MNIRGRGYGLAGPRSGLTRRKSLGTAAGAVGGALVAPYVSASEPKTIRFLNGEADPGTVQALSEIAAEWKQKTGVTVGIETVPIDHTYLKITSSIEVGCPHDIGTLPQARPPGGCRRGQTIRGPPAMAISRMFSSTFAVPTCLLLKVT